MAKLTLTDLASLTNETSAIATINNNNAAIETALENTLSRDGTTPNTMSADLDLNTHHILNLAQATQAGHAVEYTQLQDRVDEMQTLHDEAENYKNQAAASAVSAAADVVLTGADVDSAQAILDEVQALFDSYNNQYLGTFASEPTVDNDGNALTVGDLYYDSITLSFRVWDGTYWQDVASLTPSSANTLSNKSIDLTNNILTGTTAQFNAALTDDDFTTLTNTVTLTNKTLTTPKIDSILTNSGAATLTLPTSTDTLVGKATTDTLTNKSINLSSNTLSGTTSQFNTALSDDDFATLTNTVTLTNKTLTSPTLNTPSINNAVLTSPTVTTNISPTTDDGAALGSTTSKFSDLFLANGGVINFNNGDVAITHGTNSLTFSGASGGYLFDSTITGQSSLILSATNAGIELGSGAGNTPFIDFHSSANTLDYDARIIASGGTSSNGNGTLTVTAADLVIPAGTGVNSAVNRTGSQTLTNKTISFTSNTITNFPKRAIIYIIDNAGSAITTGIKGDLLIPFDCTINQWTILCDQSGSIVIDIWKDTYSNYPPTVADSITASAKPTVSSTTKGTSSTLTGWTTAVSTNDTLRFNVDSITTVTRATLILTVSI